jgi:hypothetical protein
VVIAIRKPVQRLGASRVAHRLPLTTCRTRHPYGTPTGAEPSSTRCPASPHAVLAFALIAGVALLCVAGMNGWLWQPQDLLEASPSHQFSGQAGQSECEPVMFEAGG